MHSSHLIQGVRSGLPVLGYISSCVIKELVTLRSTVALMHLAAQRIHWSTSLMFTLLAYTIAFM
jgi:hypothetical protein